MRIVSWNANYNNKKRRTLADNISLVAPLHPDLVVLSETSDEANEGSGARIVGHSSPVLAVVPFNGFSIRPLSPVGNAPPLAGFFDVSGPRHFTLGAIWPIQKKTGPRYASLLTAMLAHFATELSSAPLILTGDFNSNTAVVGQERSHPKLISRLEQAGLSSAYHHQSGEKHGRETLATFVQGKKSPKRFHIDYCFASSDLLPACTVAIPQSSAWLGLSDHFPLIIDVPDAAFRTSGDKRARSNRPR